MADGCVKCTMMSIDIQAKRCLIALGWMKDGEMDGKMDHVINFIIVASVSFTLRSIQFDLYCSYSVCPKHHDINKCKIVVIALNFARRLELRVLTYGDRIRNVPPI